VERREPERIGVVLGVVHCHVRQGVSGSPAATRGLAHC
jgi:hypothetical protein